MLLTVAIVPRFGQVLLLGLLLGFGVVKITGAETTRRNQWALDYCNAEAPSAGKLCDNTLEPHHGTCESRARQESNSKLPMGYSSAKKHTHGTPPRFAIAPSFPSSLPSSRL